MTVHNSTQPMDDADDVHVKMEEPDAEDYNEQSGDASKASAKGRVLYCRKCEGHGVQSLLKGHVSKCPFQFCRCRHVSDLIDWATRNS